MPLFSGRTKRIGLPNGNTVVLPEEIADQFPDLRSPLSLAADDAANAGLNNPDVLDRRLVDRVPTTVGQGIDRFTKPYVTQLSPEEEKKFRLWVYDKSGGALDVSPTAPVDWRGVWRARQNDDPEANDARVDSDGYTVDGRWTTPYDDSMSKNSKYDPENQTEPIPQAGGNAPRTIAAPVVRDRWLPGARPTVAQAADRATHPYETQLTPAGEKQFQAWVTKAKIPFDPGADQADYDMRGFWLASQNGDPRARTALHPQDGTVHFPDTWKTPYHRSFSDDSMYAQPGAPQWRGDVLTTPGGRILTDERGPAPPLPPGTSSVVADAAALARANVPPPADPAAAARARLDAELNRSTSPVGLPPPLSERWRQQDTSIAGATPSADAGGQ